jgi:protein-disulfide isomerase
LRKANKITTGDTGRTLLIWLPLIATAALLLSGCAAQSSQQQPRQPAEDQTRDSRTAASGSVEEDGSRSELGQPTLGDPDAPVVMVEYGDFQ